MLAGELARLQGPVALRVRTIGGLRERLRVADAGLRCGASNDAALAAMSRRVGRLAKDQEGARCDTESLISKRLGG